MWKKITVLLVALTVLFAATAPTFVEAKGFKAPKRSFNSNTQKSTVNNNPASTTTKTPNATNSATKPGFFGGGSFMKGMLVGGLAGMLFGGMFGGMGFMGEMLGLLINLLAVFVLIVLVVKVVQMFKNRRKPDEKRY